MEISQDVSDYRSQIDEIDVQLVRLLNQRAAIAQSLGKLKTAAGAQVYDAKREGQVIERVTVLNAGPLSAGAIQEIMSTVMTACREIQMKG